MTHDTLIDEKVSVWAFFDPAQNTHIFPLAMNWRRRLIKFDKVIFSSIKRVGELKLLDLICASETSNFELEYNSSNHIWRVKKVFSKD